MKKIWSMFQKPIVTQSLEPSTSSTKVFENSLRRCVILIILNYLILTSQLFVRMMANLLGLNLLEGFSMEITSLIPCSGWLRHLSSRQTISGKENLFAIWNMPIHSATSVSSSHPPQPGHMKHSGNILVAIWCVVLGQCNLQLVIAKLTFIRKIQAKMPCFQPGLSAENVVLAAALLKMYKYYGPLTLSWDDMDLEPVISVFQKSKDVCIIIGGVDGELLVQSYEDIGHVLQKAQLNKAEKVSWLGWLSSASSLYEESIQQWMSLLELKVWSVHPRCRGLGWQYFR